MTNQQLIPTQELLNQWCYAATGDWREIAAIAARWGYKQGADEELEACCEWVSPFSHDDCHYEDKLRAARRPKSLSLKEQAYGALDAYIYGERDAKDKERTYNTIRRALEQLDD